MLGSTRRRAKKRFHPRASFTHVPKGSTGFPAVFLFRHVIIPVVGKMVHLTASLVIITDYIYTVIHPLSARGKRKRVESCRIDCMTMIHGRLRQ